MRYKAFIIKILTCCLVLSCLSACRQNDGQSVKKRKLNFATVGVVKSLDPALAADVTSRNMAGAIFDTLLQYDYMARPYKLEPSILAEMPTISADNRLYTFKIRKDLYFHNDECFSSLSDRQLTVDDIIFSLKESAILICIVRFYGFFRGELRESRNLESKLGAIGTMAFLPGIRHKLTD